MASQCRISFYLFDNLFSGRLNIESETTAVGLYMLGTILERQIQLLRSHNQVLERSLQVLDILAAVDLFGRREQQVESELAHGQASLGYLVWLAAEGARDRCEAAERVETRVANGFATRQDLRLVIAPLTLRTIQVARYLALFVEHDFELQLLLLTASGM